MNATENQLYDSLAGGETDFGELLQLLCANAVNSDSTPFQSVSSADDLRQPSAMLDVDPVDVDGLRFDYDQFPFDAVYDDRNLLLDQDDSQFWNSVTEFHDQRWKQVEELGIYLGISQSLAVPMRTHSAYPSLDAGLRKELIVLYFDHVHPLCPIIDEQNFWWHFNKLSDDEFCEVFPAIMLSAMLFAAFAHTTEDQVRRAGGTSKYEIQSQYYQVLSAKYDEAQSQASCQMDELVLAKTSLLLALWCPSQWNLAVNSLWVDRAMYHSNRALRSTLPDGMSTMLPKRSDILLWCCVTWKIFISHAMRLPYRLNPDEQLLCDPEDVRAEFDRELQFHSFCSRPAKTRMVEDFVTMCKLSQNLRNVLFMQRSTLLSRQELESEDPAVRDNDAELHDCLSRYLKAAEIESQLKDLIESHETAGRDIISNNIDELGSQLVAARLRSYVLQVITYSCIASLYQSTIAMKPSPWAQSCQRTALAKSIDASRMVDSIVQDMLSSVPTQAIPGTLLTWTMIPT